MMYLWRKIFGRELPLKEDPAFNIDEAAAIAQPASEASLTAEQMEEREKQDKELREVCTRLYIYIFSFFSFGFNLESHSFVFRLLTGYKNCLLTSSSS